MPNYDQSPNLGEQYRRCHNITIGNPLGGVPYIVFEEQDAIYGKNGPVPISIGNDRCRATFDPLKSVALVDPDTLRPTGGSFTHKDLYNMLFSLYYATALERDAEKEKAGKQAKAMAISSKEAGDARMNELLNS